MPVYPGALCPRALPICPRRLGEEQVVHLPELALRSGSERPFMREQRVGIGGCGSVLEDQADFPRESPARSYQNAALRLFIRTPSPAS